jgi:hypothetical protein
LTCPLALLPFSPSRMESAHLHPESEVELRWLPQFCSMIPHAWLATLEGMHLATGRELYRRVFDFWLKVFAASFGMGAVEMVRVSAIDENDSAPMGYQG